MTGRSDRRLTNEREEVHRGRAEIEELRATCVDEADGNKMPDAVAAGKGDCLRHHTDDCGEPSIVMSASLVSRGSGL